MAEDGLVHKTVRIVRTVAAIPGGAGLSEVARESGISKATSHRILQALEREGWLTIDQDTKRFRLSLNLVLMLHGLNDGNAVSDFTRNTLRELSDVTRETTGLDSLEDGSAFVIAEVPGPQLIGQSARAVPRRLPAWRTSTGKVLLAWSDPAVIEEQFDAELLQGRLPRYPSYSAFVDDLGRIREQGYAIAYDELEHGLAAVAAPVHVGESVPYALWVGGPTFRLTPDRLDSVSETLRDAAARLGRFLEVSRTRAGGDAERVPVLGLISTS